MKQERKMQFFKKNMKTYQLNNENNCAQIASECARQLSIQGSVVLIPTETVYGLACRHDDKQARDRIYDLKARAENKPLQIFVDNLAMLDKMGAELSPLAKKIANAFCPGPVTIVVPANDGSKIGFRIPDHAFIAELLKIFKAPLAATSANRSGQPTALSTQEALEDIEGKPDIVVDEGELHPASQASTVIEVSGNKYSILRHGPITEEMINNALSK